jgi:predicted enzyme related to lactoylglutathione lyase
MPLQLLANIDVDDLDQEIAFYRDAFDLSIGRRFGDDGVEMLGSSAPIYLLLKPAGTLASAMTTQQRDYRRHWTPVHLDFVVQDVNAATEKAQAAGALLEGAIHTYNWGRIAHMADPFGHGFCLLQFLGRGYDEIAT